MPLPSSPEGLFQVPSRGWVYGLVAADVVLARDRGTAVTERLGCELEATDLVDRGGGGAAEPVWGDVGDAVHQSYSDFIMRCALLASRGSEVAGLQVGDVDWDQRIVTIRHQTFPGSGGLVTKQTKGREIRHVPIRQPLEPVPRRLTIGREPQDRLLTGPRGGVLTTATVRDATRGDTLVSQLGLANLARHGLRHTGATWLADAGIPLHVLQGSLGLKSLETMRGYLHPDTRHLADAAAQTNAFLSGQDANGVERPALGSRVPRSVDDEADQTDWSRFSPSLSQTGSSAEFPRREREVAGGLHKPFGETTKPW